jgi:hypothetical protein
MRAKDLEWRLDPRTGDRVLFAGGFYGPIYIATLFQQEVCVACMPVKGRQAQGLLSTEGQHLVLSVLHWLTEKCPQYSVQIMGSAFVQEEAWVAVKMTMKRSDYSIAGSMAGSVYGGR